MFFTFSQISISLLPKKVPSFCPFLLIFTYILATFAWSFFLANFGQFSYCPSMFISTICLQMNSIFFEKCKNEFKNGVLLKNSPPWLVDIYFLSPITWKHFLVCALSGRWLGDGKLHIVGIYNWLYLQNSQLHTHNLFRVQFLNNNGNALNQIFQIVFMRKSSRIKFC